VTALRDAVARVRYGPDKTEVTQALVKLGVPRIEEVEVQNPFKKVDNI
jgi:hypothetical protein